MITKNIKGQIASEYVILVCSIALSLLLMGYGINHYTCNRANPNVKTKWCATNVISTIGYSLKNHIFLVINFLKLPF